jgi:P4 family phage/plasmid primase-like protien
MSTLREFLNEHRVSKKEPYTHTGILTPFRGSFFVEDEELPVLNKLYYDQIVKNKGLLSITEKPKDVSSIRIDIDLHHSPRCKERTYDTGFVKKFVKIYVDSIKTFHNIEDAQMLQAFVFEKEEPRFCAKNDVMKDGIHIMFPFIPSSYTTQHAIRDKALQECIDQKIFEPLELKNKDEDVIDHQVISKNNWMMFGSTSKKGQNPYKISYILDHHLRSSMSTYSLEDMLELLCLRKDEEETEISEDPEAQEYLKRVDNRLNKKKTKKKRTVPTINFDTISDKFKYYEKMVQLLSSERAESYETWIRVGWCLHNIDRELLYLWKDFSQKSDNYDEEACDDLWQDMDEEGLGFRSLVHWAKIDDPEGYRELEKENICELLKLAVYTKTNCDVASILEQLYKGEYAFDQDTWYKFENNKWNKVEKYDLRKKISEIVVTEIHKMQSSFDDEEEEKLKLIIKLKSTSYKNDVMTECKELFYQPDFEEKLDSKMNLMGFKNGVYNLDEKEFRDGLPEDLITFNTNVNKIKYDPDTEEAKGINKFFDDIMPNQENKEFLLKRLASCLHGVTKEELFFILTGIGANGKTKLFELLRTGFGNYVVKLAESTLTQKRTASNAATPGLVRTKGRRIAYLEETEENSRINASFMKEFTGGGTMIARDLFKKPVEFNVMCKLFLLCNKPPEMSSNDGGSLRRIVAFEFPSHFTEKPDPTNKDHKPIDRSISQKFPKWKEMFMAMLIDVYYPKYMKEGLKIPVNVQKFTEGYQMSHNYILGFVNECIEKTDDPSDCLKIKSIYANFKVWYTDSTSGGIPKKNDLSDFFTKKFGKPHSKYGWRGLKFVISEEDQQQSMFSSSLDN